MNIRCVLFTSVPCVSRPEYAPESSDEDDDADFGGLGHMKKTSAAAPGGEKMSAELDDRRLKRLQRQLEKEDDVEERLLHAYVYFSGL